MGTLQLEEPKPSQFASWDTGITPTASIDFDKPLIDPNSNQLTVLKTNEVHTNRPIIPATVYEKLAFYRAYVSSPSKTQIICTQQAQFNKYLWFHVMNVFCKSLPNTYIYMFLSSYVPDQHLFLSKMVPLAYGTNLVFVVAGLIYLVLYIDTVVFLLDYIVTGVFYKNPWNRCYSEYVKISVFIAKCLDIEAFYQVTKNETLVFESGIYLSAKNESYQLAPIIYYRHRYADLKNTSLYFIFLWITAVFNYKQLYNRRIWKMLNNVQMILTALYLITFTHLVIAYFETDLKSIPIIYDEYVRIIWAADTDILSESMTAPPIVHVLTSRSTTKINPDRDSIAMIFSNSLYYIFRGLLGYRLKIHCENMVKCPIFLTEFNPNSYLFLWPIYFSAFYLGNFYTLLYFTLSFLMEYLTIIITMQCLIETIVFEWRWANRILVSVALCILGIMYNFITHFVFRILLYMYTISSVTTFEVIFIYCLYPLGRLVDDITFFHGVSPTKFRIINFRIVPVYYLIKMYEMFKGFFHVFRSSDYGQIMNFELIFYSMSIPFLLGAIYISFVHVCVKNKSFKSLIKPLPAWGPRNVYIRQLRKMYDSRYYVGSQAPRNLSRYMIHQTSLDSYRLDLQYDHYVRKSTLSLTEVKNEDEKKRK
ncbi:PREDICTED: uncharacterized protein LOC106111090 [Papilio polytes]|uniref:uncharacterized protein LOC106111090 n=1 Tax=Papilio polytes TaxID=76194 RepID=UPI0006763CC8|nr:PREDICTED: uncharacterized protein LOC106111090 [Papilio polytes]